MLRAEAVIAAPRAGTTPVDAELQRFDAHLDQVRGLAVNTRAQYRRKVDRLLREHFAEGHIDLAAITPDDLREFVTRQSALYRTPGVAANLPSAVRGYLRFRTTCGDRVPGLSGVLSYPANWQQATLPQALSRAEVARLVASLGGPGPSACRTAAPWPVRTPTDDQPGRVRAAHCPHDRPLGPDAVGKAIRRAYTHSGLPYTRAHLLRHALASRLLASGSSLKEVADVLRHRSLNTTQSMRYALASFVRQVDARGSEGRLMSTGTQISPGVGIENSPPSGDDGGFFGRVGPRLTLHIYTPEEIAGLRVAEALQLHTADVDLTAGLLTVRQTKFAKSRHVPLHPSIVTALQHYATQRQRQVANSADTDKPVPTPSFSTLVQQFFTDYLLTQRPLSPHTVASYRDAMLLFLDFAHQYLGKARSAVCLTDLQPAVILAFLNHLEQQRGNSVRSRNLRLTALRAFLKFAAHRDLTALQTIEQALGVPMKRFDRLILGFLTRDEMLAVIGAPGTTWTAQRDHLLFTLLYKTGARVSEIPGVRVADVVLDASPCVHLHGKGRKQRAVPLWPSTIRAVRAWLRRNPAMRADAPLLPNRNRRPITRHNVNQRPAIAVARAAVDHPTLAKRHVSPHCIRHTTAMHMLQSGVAFRVIALWLGHETPTTTHRYVEANLAMKEQALARLEEPGGAVARYRPPDELRQFLEAL